MASSSEHDTLICLFHHTDRAERTVQELLEIGIPQAAISLIGHARETADIDTGTATLDSINVPQADRKRLMDGLRAGGSIVAVSADPALADKIERIFKEYSADKIDEKVITTPDSEILRTGTTEDASAYPGSITEEYVDLPPVNRVITVDAPIIETSSSVHPIASSTPSSSYVDEPIDEILLITEPSGSSLGAPGVVTIEETLVLLEPTDLVEDTDLVEPANGRSTGVDASSDTTGRFDPDAPVDDVRNPMSDRLNDPLNRR